MSSFAERNGSPMHRLFFFIATLNVLVSSVAAQEAGAAKATRERWQDYYQKVAAGYEFYLESDDEEPLKVNPKSLLDYHHPAAMKGTHGAFFVWTKQSRPHVIGSIWSERIQGGRRTVMHELHSLSTDGLLPVDVGIHGWSPSKGIEMKPIPNATAPSKSKHIRKVQLRSVARKFKGFANFDGKDTELRRLPEPIYRYESEVPDVLGGGIFAFFTGWDPEIMLLIEARKTENGNRWYFGAGRFGVAPLRFSYDGKDVWKVGRSAESYPRSVCRKATSSPCTTSIGKTQRNLSPVQNEIGEKPL